MIKLIIIIVFLVGSALLKSLQGQNDQPKGQRPKRPAPQPPQPPQPPRPMGPLGPMGPGQPAPVERLESEIEEFLRRASHASHAGKPATQAPPPEPQRRAQPLVSTPDVVEADVVERVGIRGSSLSEHVRDHIGSRPLGGDERRLGGSISREIDDMESHVHDVFDHQLGSLKKIATRLPTDLNDIDDRGTDSSMWEGVTVRNARIALAQKQRAEEIRQMLIDPSSVQKAVILGEILKRPNF